MKYPDSGALSRRSFLRTGALAGSALFIHSQGFASPFTNGSSQRVRVAVMGVNGRGSQLVQAFAADPGSEVVYICDVDSRVLAPAVEIAANAGQKLRAQGLADFRRALDDKTIDALVIAAPDHWHAPAALLALQAGKHVYVEKPGSHNPAEAIGLARAADRYGKNVQLGNQRRSWVRVRDAIGQLHAGAIGRVDFARAWYTNGRPTIGKGQRAAVPEWLNYDLWQGPAPRRDFKNNLIHYNWHWHWHWGTGEMLNNGTHFIDLARWGLNSGLPVQTYSTGGRYAFQDDWETPDTQVASFRFADGKSLQWEGRSTNRHRINGMSSGVTFHGDQGSLELQDNSYRIYNAEGDLVREEKSSVNTSSSVTGPGFDFDKDHAANFNAAIRDGAKLNSDYRECYKSALLCHLANVSLRTGSSLNTDPTTGTITDSTKAMAYWSREYQSGWNPKF